MGFRSAIPAGGVLVLSGAFAWLGACGNGAPPAGPSSFPVDAGTDTGPAPVDSGKLKRDAGRLGDSAAPKPVELILTPAAATIVVTGNGPVSANFNVQAKTASGELLSVQPQSVQFDRPDLATVTSNNPIVATAPSSSTLYGGTGKVHAVYQGLEGTATLTVKVAVTDYGSGLSASSPSVVALNGGASPDGGKKDASVDGGGASLPTDRAANISPLLYPYDKTVWPLGLTSPRIMWNAPQTGDVYHVHYAEQNYTFDGYYTLTTLPAQMPLAQATWDTLTASNLGPSDPLGFALSRYDSVQQKAYLTSTQTWTVAPQSLQGAIYYWTASENAQGVRVGHVSRFRPGTGATPQQLDNGECVGCHAVNAQGTVLIGNVDDTAGNVPDGAAPATTTPPYTNGFNDTRAWARFDITQPSSPITYQSTKYGADIAVTPDGKYIVFGGQVRLDGGASPPGSKFISLGDPTNGNVVADSGLDDLPGDAGALFDLTQTSVMMPAFSPDGTKLAVVVSPTENDSFADNVLPEVLTTSPTNPPESVAYLKFDESGPAFNPTLVKLFDSNNAAFANLGGQGVAWNGIAYPSFTPASDAVAFHVGQYATGCNSFNVNSDAGPAVACGDLGNDDGVLFIATLADGNPIRMANADTPPIASDANSAVEPTFNPVPRGGYSWVVFTSLRAFGNQPWPSEVPQDAGLINAKRRLWVAAVDPVIGTTDPSHPAIYLEGQDDTPNMRAFWTLSSCIATPGASGVDGGAPGDGGKSGDAGTSAAADGGSGACTYGFQCCSGFCNDGMCVDVSSVACVGTGQHCTSQTGCCNSGLVACQNGTCTPTSGNK